MLVAPWMAAGLTLLGALGPFLLARRTLGRPAARAFVLAGIIGLLLYALVALLGPLGAGETNEKRLYAVGDAILGGALVALAALGVKRLYVLVGLLAAALVVARALSSLLSARSGAGLGLDDVLTAFLWGAAAVVAAGIFGARFMRSARRPTRR